MRSAKPGPSAEDLQENDVLAADIWATLALCAFVRRYMLRCIRYASRCGVGVGKEFRGAPESGAEPPPPSRRRAAAEASSASSIWPIVSRLPTSNSSSPPSSSDCACLQHRVTLVHDGPRGSYHVRRLLYVIALVVLTCADTNHACA